ncbi:alginate export family protein [Wenyingzhuangia sp. IMCC45533]
MSNKYLSLVFLVVILLTNESYSQDIPLIKGDLNVDAEYRPRTELRRGYRALPRKNDKASFSTSHRARINLDYKINNFLLHTTLQDIRVWGDTDTRDADGKAQFFEFYVQPKISENLYVRVGRQRIKYDDQRFFAENNWRQAGGQHDAVKFMYQKNNVKSDLILAYNQNRQNLFGNQHDIDWDFYRGLIANYSKIELNNQLTVTGLNFADEYTDPSTDNKKGYWKFTNGGTINYHNRNLMLSLAAYYQWGRIESGKKHRAFYIEPKVKLNFSEKYSLTIATQVFSGDGNNNDDKSSAFLTQYGAFHRHNGQLDYTQLTVRTNEHEGIINPYITQDYKFTNKLALNWQSHLLGAETNLFENTDNGRKKLNKFYAWENDFKFIYRANHYTKLEMAYLFLLANDGIKALSVPQNGDTSEVAQFLYLAVTWTPKLYSSKR